MTQLAGLTFLSPGEAPLRSPLAHVLEGVGGIEDLSLLGKLEVRRVEPASLALDVEVIPLAPRRALVLCPLERRTELRAVLPGFVVDVTGALAGIAVAGERLLHRLTDLDLDALPASGKVAGVPAILTRRGEDFAFFFAQEYGESVVETVRDTMAGLA